MTNRRHLPLILLFGLLALGLGVFALSQTRVVRQRALIWTEAFVSEALGREVRAEGVAFWPWRGGLELRGVQVARDRTLADGVLFSAETIRAGWRWSALLRRQLVVQQINLTRPRLTLSEGGTPEIRVQEIVPLLLRSRGVQAGALVLRIGRVAIRDGQVTWAEQDGTRGSLDGLEGELTWSESPDGVTFNAGSLRAVRLHTTRGGATHQLDRISLQLAGAPNGISVSLAEFHMAGARVTAKGGIADPGREPLLDLTLGVEGPLRSLLLMLGSAREVEGEIAANGRLQGPWGHVVFRGEGNLRFGKDRKAGEPLRFTFQWGDGRLEAETLHGPPRTDGLFQGRLSLEVATGVYRIRATLTNTDLAALAGLPAALAAQAGVQVPPDVRGRLNADVDLVGRGTDLAALRGQASLRAEGLALEGETPAGHLEARLVATASRADIETFTLQLPGGDIEGRGGLNFTTGKLDLPIRADLRDVATFGRGFGLPFLGGHATLNGRVVGTRDTPRFRGRVAWRDARIAGHSLDVIEGEVEAGRRVLRTPRLLLRTGRTTVLLSGNLEAPGFAPLRRLNPKRDLALDLQVQLNPARTVDLADYLPDDLEIQGAFRAKGRLSGTLEALSGEMEVAFDRVRTWEESWGRGDALIRFRQGDVEISRISLRRGAERLIGEIGVGGDGALRGRLTSTVMDVARVGSLSGSNLAGRASFRLDLQGTLRETVTLGQATASTLSYRGVPLGPGRATFKIERKAVDVDLTIRDGTHRLQVSVGPPSNRSVKGELTLSDADMDLVAQVGDLASLRDLQARVSGRILFHGPSGDTAFDAGEADLTNLHLQLRGESWENRGAVQASWSRRTLTVEQLLLRSGGGELDIRGTAAEEGQADLKAVGQFPLRMLAAYFPVFHPMEGLATADLHLRGHRSNPEIDGTLEIQQGQLGLSGVPAEFQEVHARVMFQGSRIQIQQWQAKLAEGNFQGSGEIRRQGERWGLQLTFQEDDARTEQLVTGIYRGKGEVTGALSLGGTLTSEGEDAVDFWRNLDGDLTLTARDGRIGRYTITAKILSVLSVAQLVDLKGPEFSAEGMPYQRMTADIKIRRGVARTENFVLDSRAMRMNAVGTINLAEDAVDLTVAVKPFQNMDRAITKIPVAGWLLGGKEKSLVVAYFRVTGPLSEPQVTPIPLKSVGRNLFGIFRNMLGIPEALTSAFENLPPQQVKPDAGQQR